MTDKNKSKMRFFIPPVIVLLGIVIMVSLAKSRKKPPQHTREYAGVLIDVVKAELGTSTIEIEATGTVQPRYQVNLMPQVTGKVEWVHPEYVAGGSFGERDTLLIIEQDDYKLAVRQMQAGLAQAEYLLELEQANSAIARREWELMSRSNGDDSVEPDPLVLRQPQLKQADAAYQSAMAGLEKAELNLARTIITAPFNCRVRKQSIAPGQLVGQGSSLGIIYETDIAEIQLGLPVSDLEWIKVPGAKAEVEFKVGSTSYIWDGRVDRSVGVLDEIGRLARVVVRVEKPFRKRGIGNPELSIGSFVHVSIKGRDLENTIAIPRSAMRENNTLWIAKDDGTLDIRNVTYHRLTPKEALVSSGIEAGENIVLTSIAAASSGMKLRFLNAEEM